MHDPAVVAFDVRGPWLRKGYQKGPRFGLVRRRYTHGRAGEPMHPAWRPAAWELFLGGTHYRLGTLATIWHEEPDGHDALTVCRGQRWQWHVRHWRIQLPWLGAWRRRLFTRCAYCTGRSGKGRDVVNCSPGWDASSSGKHWWSSEQNLYHQECLGADKAWTSCVCPEPNPPRRITMAWYWCGNCNGSRMVDRSPTATAVLNLYRIPPRGTRPSRALVAQISGLWERERSREAVSHG